MYADATNMLVKVVSHESSEVSAYTDEAIIGQSKFTFKYKEIKLCFFSQQNNVD